MRKSKNKVQKFIEKINVKGDRYKKLSLFGENIQVPVETYDALQYLVKKIGWDELAQSSEFKSLNGFILDVAQELRAQELQEKERYERFSGKGKKREDFKLAKPKDEAHEDIQGAQSVGEQQ